ncbi:hypothetical protein IF1G_06744 [Cordyceps javanica]|uniref:Uncharacterized protein n=1 Tax=Cordyceps javanica TaxID=43265 RepID=A0A545UZ55_9HYPO|nr:hypothetical protein IF1G_06744 [Cordyceps javanica]
MHVPLHEAGDSASEQPLRNLSRSVTLGYQQLFVPARATRSQEGPTSCCLCTKRFALCYKSQKAFLYAGAFLDRTDETDDQTPPYRAC